MVFPWGSAIAAGSSIFGNVLGAIQGGAQNQSATNQAWWQLANQNQQFNRQMDWSREQFDRQESLTREGWTLEQAAAARAEALQREFAQSGLRWKIEDAKSAGVHPLFALGGAGAAYAPPAVSYDGSLSAPMPGGSPGVGQPGQVDIGANFRAMGQDVSRAALATMDREDRALAALRLDSLYLDNQLKRKELARPTRATIQVGPPMPSGVGSTSGMTANTPTPSGAHSVLPQIAAGQANPYVQFVDVGNGLRPQPAPGVKAEDEFGAPLMFQWLADVYTRPSHYPPPQEMVESKWGKGVKVEWDNHRQMWRPLHQVFPEFKGLYDRRPDPTVKQHIDY